VRFPRRSTSSCSSDHHVRPVHGRRDRHGSRAVSCFLGFAICLPAQADWRKFLDSMTDTLRISCMVFMIVAGGDFAGS